jgi:hypothetical protein
LLLSSAGQYSTRRGERTSHGTLHVQCFKKAGLWRRLPVVSPVHQLGHPFMHGSTCHPLHSSLCPI